MTVAASVAGGLVLVTWAQVTRLDRNDPWTEPVVVSACAVLVAGWLVVPLLVGFTDGTVDPTRVAHLPLSLSELVAGLLVAGTLGIMPVATVLGASALVMLAPSPLAATLILLQVLMLVVVCVLVSQVGSAVLAGLVKGRVGRDVAVVVMSIMSTVAAVGFQTSVEVGVAVSLDQIQQVSNVAQYTPGGWLGWGIASASSGRVLPGVIALAASAGFGLALAILWAGLLERILSRPATGLAGPKHQTPERALWPEFRILGFIASDDVKAVATRTLITARRDPRALMSMAGQVPLLLVLTLPALPLLLERHHLSVLSAGTLGFYGAMMNTNLFGFDGRGVWLDLLAAPSMRSVLWGKTIAHAVIVAPLFLAVVFGLAAWTGGWEFIIPTTGLAIVWYGSAAGVQSLTSVLAPIPAPERSTPWEGNSSGAGLASALTLMTAVFAAMILAVPGVALIGGLSVWSAKAATLATPVAAAYGIMVWMLGMKAATKRANEQPWLIFGPLSARH